MSQLDLGAIRAKEQQMTAATLEAVKKICGAGNNEDLAKSWVQSNSAVSGLTFYDLESGAKLLYPVITPLRNEIPRVSGRGGIQANWRGITGVNTTNMSAGVSFGNRSGRITSTTKDYIAAYRAIGLEDSVDFEAELAAQGFDDVRAIAVEGLLRSLMMQEERIDLGGNNSLALGTTPTPTTIDGGATPVAVTAASAHSIYCVALTRDGWENSGGPTNDLTVGLPGQISRVSADGSNTDTFGGGNAKVSLVSTLTPTQNHPLNMSVAPVPGAFAYAWYWGTSTGAGATLGAITTINSYQALTDSGAGTQAANDAKIAADYSQNTLVYDGLLTQISTTTNNSYIARLATGTVGTGTPLTTDNAGGIVEIDTAFKSFWDNYRLSPDTMWVNSQEQKNISLKVLAAASTSSQRFVFDTVQGAVVGGTLVRSYLNKFTMNGAQEVPIRLHPNIPPGTIMFTSSRIPYPLSNVTNVLQIRARRDYYQIEWPLRTRKYEFGIYSDQVLQNYFTPAFGVIKNIGNG